MGAISCSGLGSSASGDVTGTNHGNRRTSWAAEGWTAPARSSGRSCLGGSGYEEGHSVQQTAHGGHVLSGTSWSSASGTSPAPTTAEEDFWVAR